MVVLALFLSGTVQFLRCFDQGCFWTESLPFLASEISKPFPGDFEDVFVPLHLTLAFKPCLETLTSNLDFKPRNPAPRPGRELPITVRLRRKQFR